MDRSTPQSPVPRVRVRAIVPLVVTLIVLASAEVAVRVVAPRVELDAWNNWETTNKAEAIDALSKTGGASVVFLGSSMTNAAVDPNVFTKLVGLKRPAFNAALDGAGVRVADLWGLRFVVPGLRPTVAVIGLSSRELNDSGFQVSKFYNQIRHSPAGRSAAPDLRPVERIHHLAETSSYLIRYRGRLRTPSTLFGEPLGKLASPVGPLGEPISVVERFADATYTLSKSIDLLASRDFFRNLDLEGAEFGALNHLVDSLVAAKIRVILVEMPITTDAIKRHPNGIEDYHKFEGLLARFADRAQVIDASEWFSGTDEFADLFHLNGAGRSRFTRNLADVFGYLSPSS